MFSVPSLVTIQFPLLAVSLTIANVTPVKPLFDCMLMFLLDVLSLFSCVLTVLLYKKATLTYS